VLSPREVVLKRGPTPKTQSSESCSMSEASLSQRRRVGPRAIKRRMLPKRNIAARRCH